MAESKEVLAKLGVGKIRRHIFLCVGPKCCQEEQGQKAWEVLKAGIAQAGLGQGEEICFRTRVGCLRLCQDGPVALVYPEGTWYTEVTEEKIPRLIEEHLKSGKVVDEWANATNPLDSQATGRS